MSGPVRRRHRGRGLLITLLVIVVLLVAADRIGDYVAGQVAADKLQSSQHLANKPSVDITGFPFLTQLASGDYDRVRISAKDVQIGDADNGLDLSQVVVNLHDLHVSRNFSSFHADTADATATAGFAQLSQALGITVSYAAPDKIKASKQITVLGQTITPTITVQPHLDGQELRFDGGHVDAASQLASVALNAFADYFDLRVPVDNLPFRVRATSLHVSTAGLVLSLTGSDITYTQGS